MCYNEIGLCAQNILTIMVSIDNKIGRTYVIVNRRKKIFTLGTSKFVSNTPLLELEMGSSRFTNANRMRHFSIESNGQLSMELQDPTIGQHIPMEEYMSTMEDS